MINSPIFVICLDSLSYMSSSFPPDSPYEPKIYVDGKLDATLAAPTISYQNFNMWFGGGPADNQFWLTGIIDEIEIWNDALEDADIENLFNAPPESAVEASGKLAITWGDVKSQ